MLIVFMDSDILSTVLKMYERYPFSDITLSLVTTILGYAINPKQAGKLEKE